MAKNEVYRVGQHVPGPVPEGTDSGDPVRLGGLNAVAVTPRNDVEGQWGGHLGEASLDLGGAHIFDVAITNGPLKFGQPIYITEAGALVTAVGTNALFGHTLEYNVPNGTHPVTVRLSN